MCEDSSDSCRDVLLETGAVCRTGEQASDESTTSVKLEKILYKVTRSMTVISLSLITDVNFEQVKTADDEKYDLKSVNDRFVLCPQFD